MRKGLLLSLLLVAVPALAGIVQVGFRHYGQQNNGRTVFYTPYTGNGFLASGSLPGNVAGGVGASVPTPTIVWSAESPLANQIDATETLTLVTGAPTNTSTPFCPSSDYSDVTNSTNCRQGKVFNGATPDKYQFATTSVGQIGATAMSVCFIAGARVSTAAAEIAVSSRDITGGTNEGWSFGFLGNRGCTMYTDDGPSSTTNNGPSGTAGWQVCCASVDVAGDTQTVWSNGAVGSTTTVPGTSSIDNLVGLAIGAAPDGSTPFYSNLLAVYIWEGTALSSAQVLQFTYGWMGILTANGVQPNVMGSSGPAYCWVDGALELFADEHARVGCENPPGSTGAGTPTDGGLTVQHNAVNFLLQSEDLGTTWTAAGTVVGAGGAVTPFRDGRTNNWKLTDDDAGAVEEVYQTANISALSTAQAYSLCVIAKADSAQSLDVQIVEQTVCAGSTKDFTAASLTTSWQVFQFATTLSDGTCTEAVVHLTPSADISSAAGVGHAYVIPMLMNVVGDSAASGCSNYVRTTTASATLGLVDVRYLADTTNVLTSTTMQGAYEITGSFNFGAYQETGGAGDKYAWAIGTSASNNNAVRLVAEMTGADVATLRTTTGGAASTATVTGFAASTPGTWMPFVSKLNYDSDIYSTFFGTAAPVAHSLTVASPAAPNRIAPGQDSAFGANNGDVTRIKQFKIVRR